MNCLTPKQLKQFQNRKIGRKEQIVRVFPNKYLDARKETGVPAYCCGSPATIIGTLTEISTKEVKHSLLIKAVVKDRLTGKSVHIAWFGLYGIYKEFQYKIGSMVLVHGPLTYEEQWGKYQMSNPPIFTSDIANNLKVHADYGKKKGITTEAMEAAVKEACESPLTEYIPENYLAQNHLPTIQETARGLHFPTCPEEVLRARARIHFDEMLEFAIGMKQKEMPSGKPNLVIQSSALTHQVIRDLPYTLTPDQERVVTDLYNEMSAGRKLNALIQGDVACGKTITAFLLMFMAVENGYQSILMAPTTVLAMQHFKELEELAARYGKKAVYLKSGATKKEKEEILKAIKQGGADFIISTHAAIYNVEYANLGMIVIDEEHKFGVETREYLKEKCQYDVPFITMSATPIPRSLATTIYGNGTRIFTIANMPSGRQPVSTIACNNNEVPALLERELEKGRQAYVVCPLIDEAKEDSIMSHCQSVEETMVLYTNHFMGNPNVRVESLTGRNKKEETEQILKDFKENKIQVLISTTVIEVGVNNPNATVIVLQNAERYGLTSMHQLRGRVRRGSYKPYCLLCSEKAEENPRIQVMCKTDNGFEIAEEDLKLRKTGNLLGLEQSGSNLAIELIEQYPEAYIHVKKVADQMLERKEEEGFLEYRKQLKIS